jgi:hypothetical protein
LFNNNVIKTGDKSSFYERFIFMKRLVFYYSRSVGNRRTALTFVDEDLKSREASDYQRREDYTPKGC